MSEGGLDVLEAAEKESQVAHGDEAPSASTLIARDAADPHLNPLPFWERGRIQKRKGEKDPGFFAAATRE